MSIKLAIIGGDLRQLVMASKFAKEDDIECAVCGFDSKAPVPPEVTRTDAPEDAIRGAAAVILPLPASADKLHITAPYTDKEIFLVSVLSLLQEEQLLLGGMLDKRVSDLHVKTFDYYEREEMKILNAVPTAEGAIGIAMEELPVTVHNSKMSVLGFGRVGKALALRLKALGAHVTVCARKEGDLAFAESLGMHAVSMRAIQDALSGYSCVFNTVPSTIIREPLFDYLGKDTLVIDLAARPGGVDFDSARQHGIKVVWALSLPGKTSPVTAGEIIQKACVNILKQEGVL
ncbi:MAG: dipicolinate synthase subunit DpsA [Eubacteriales bacterium]|nr:dipicolinate synthase subunit DpsA [Eubacteriales bacterium]